MTKVNVTALRTFSHGNIDATEGKTYSMNKGEAQELEKAGFVSIRGENPEQVQVDTPLQDHQKGDVVVDEKMADAPENKMADAPANKSRAKKAE